MAITRLLNRSTLINRRSLAVATTIPMILLTVYVGLTIKPPTHAASTAPPKELLELPLVPAVLLVKRIHSRGEVAKW